MRQEIAVIGGGAKAAALAAKAASFRATKWADVHVTIIERATIGANWDGSHGYTDGIQPLCTPAERDLGFPYDPASYGEAVALHMQAEYSWMAHTVRQTSDPAFSTWVNRGSPRPTHGQFAAYLRDAVRRSRADVITGTCIGLDFGGTWSVDFEDSAGRHSLAGFDGVVVTSPGPQIAIGSLVDRRLFDGASFWDHLPDVHEIASKEEGPIVIIGIGGTAAAIAAWFVNNGFRDREIVIVANRPTIYTRTNNLFENRMFTDELAWGALTTDQRLEFNQRLTRGVVWDAVTETLERADNLKFRTSHVTDIQLEGDPGDGTEPEISVIDASGRELPAAIVVNARGFDSAWYRSLLGPALLSAIPTDTKAVEAAMNPDLSLGVSSAPGLHVPFLAGNVGPGLTSLMVLGAMADRILKPYVQRSRT